MISSALADAAQDAVTVIAVVTEISYLPHTNINPCNEMNSLHPLSRMITLLMRTRNTTSDQGGGLLRGLAQLALPHA